METTEKIRVKLKIVRGETVCICKASKQRCSGLKCVEDWVTRDKYDGWQNTINNRYGK